MHKIVYYVATSIDGYIAGPEDDVSKFFETGKGVDHYLEDLKAFRTVIMGRTTYEFGYQFGLIPGQPAYPHMQHYIFSETLVIEKCAPNVHIEKPSLKRIEDILKASNTDVYLCGGGHFAGWLLDHEMIDVLKIKLNPIILGSGIPLFGNSVKTLTGKLLEKISFEEGLEILTYELK